MKLLALCSPHITISGGLLHLFILSSLQPDFAIANHVASVLHSATESCNTSTTWDLTSENYVNLSVNVSVLDWQKSLDDGTRLDQALGRMFGSNNFRCGIGRDSSCAAPICFDFENEGLEPWVYLVAVSVSNLNTMFQNMWEGIDSSTTDITNLVDDLSTNVFGFEDPIFVGDDIAFWVTAALATVATFGMLSINTIGTGLRTLISAAGAFGGATAAQVAQSLAPVTGLARSDGEEVLHDVIANFSRIAREALEKQADDTFSGKHDEYGLDIVNYIDGGLFLSELPKVTEVAQYYKSVLVARIMNLLWRTKSIYVISTTSPILVQEYSQNISWISPATSRTYIAFRFDGSHQVALPGIATLTDPVYNISAWQVAQSSGLSWEAAGNNYTNALNLKSITDVGYNASLTFSQLTEGAGAEGVFRLPVCDVGERIESLRPYGNTVLPCCCGPDCKDTRAFIEAAILEDAGSFISMCKTQWNGSAIDYGNAAPTLFNSAGSKAAIVAGVLLALLITI